MESYNFTEPPSRVGTGSIKWDRYRDQDVLPMWVADMDFESPPEVVDAIHRRVAHGIYGYTNPTDEALDAVVQYMHKAHGVAIEPGWLLWTPGLVPALNTAARAYCESGEAILTTVPIYPPFLSASKYQERSLTYAALQCNEGSYRYDWEALERAINPETRIFYVCNPHNPVGRVWSDDELSEVLKFCKRHNLLLLSDEIHCDLILEEGLQHRTALAIDDWCHDHSLTLLSPSKTFNLCGLACSFVIIPNAQLRRKFHRAMRGLFNELNCLGYAACAAAYNEGMPWKNELLGVLRHNYSLIREAIMSDMPRFKLTNLEATYLAWIDTRNVQTDDLSAVFERYGVGFSAGAEFGTPGFLRFNFGCTTSRVREALDRMINGYQSVIG